MSSPPPEMQPPTAAPPPAATLKSDTSSDDRVARSAGRGGIAVAGAKVYFILTGLVQQIALKAVLGLSGYGALSSVLSAASIAYNPIVTTSIQGVSRAVAASPEHEQPQALRRVLSVHAIIAVLTGLGFFVAAPFIGPELGAEHIVLPLQVLSAILFLYGLYSPLVGALNGRKQFLTQASLDALAATLRTVGLIGGAYWLTRHAAGDWGGVEGATLGFVGGACVVLVVALIKVGVGHAGSGGPSVAQHLAFIAPVLAGQLLLNLLFQADALLLRKFAAESAVAANLSETAADALVGAYRAAQLFCFLPYQLLLAITFILFPMLASAHRDGNTQAVRNYVSNGVRLALVLMGLMVSVTSGLHGQLVDLVYGADAAVLGGPPMKVLSLGLGAFALFGVFSSVLNSLKHEQASAIVTVLAVILVGSLCLAQVRGAAFGPNMLVATAYATTIALVLATAAAGFLVWRYTGALVPPLAVVRVLLAMALAIGLGRLLPSSGKVMALVHSAAVATCYLVVLLISRELSKHDLRYAQAVLRRGER